jgi:hypothetical protein
VFSDDDRQIDVYVRAGNKKTAIALVVGGAE